MAQDTALDLFPHKTGAGAALLTFNLPTVGYYKGPTREEVFRYSGLDDTTQYFLFYEDCLNHYFDTRACEALDRGGGGMGHEIRRKTGQ